jgi:hypothetical protein
MDHSPPPDLTLQLPRDLYHQIVHTLRTALPPPATDTPQAAGSDPGQALARRDNAAIAEVASLLPANAEEVTLAAQFVAASAQALDCLRLAREHAADLWLVLKCSAQAAAMMRQARSARSLLLQVQATRQKREADGVAAGKAAWIEHCAVGLMAGALGRDPPAEPPPVPAAEPAPVPMPAPQSGDACPRLAEAEQYALIYRRRAALIRSLGGLPDKCDFGPPSPELVAAIVTGTSPILRALDAPAAA